MTTFVVATEHEETIRVLDFESKEKKDDFTTKATTIDVVTKEEILLIARITSDFKKLQQIIVLTVNITNDTNWFFNLYQV